MTAEARGCPAGTFRRRTSRPAWLIFVLFSMPLDPKDRCLRASSRAERRPCFSPLATRSASSPSYGGRRVRNSGRGSVLVNEPAQHVAPANACGPQVAGCCRRVTDRRPKVKPPMRPSLVVMRDVGPKDPLQVSSLEDQGAVQALGSDRAHPPFAERVG